MQRHTQEKRHYSFYQPHMISRSALWLLIAINAFFHSKHVILLTNGIQNNYKCILVKRIEEDAFYNIEIFLKRRFVRILKFVHNDRCCIMTNAIWLLSTSEYLCSAHHGKEHSLGYRGVKRPTNHKVIELRGIIGAQNSIKCFAELDC